MILEIKNLSFAYKDGDKIKQLFDDVSLSFENGRFYCITGPSGSGKTTLLSLIGTIENIQNGQILLDGKNIFDDPASYRKDKVGFVFQSYNLIPHQTVLSNVELALTISGIKKNKRKQMAIDALKEVGLEEHLHKRPNQLSGGQMQRVAIARALVNDPKILLADEPTGALDTETGIQVMEILKKVAEKRLVVMVTHNPELAEQYSTRIVRLKDGKITGDSNPFEVEEKEENNEKVVTFGKSKMSFLTSLLLSFNNLRTKKARTIITSVAGSIGIIGIALILALSNGVNEYISVVQRETMESYPIMIDGSTYDYSDYFDHIDNAERVETEQVNGSITPVVEDYDSDYYYTPKEKKNNLSKFLKFLNAPENNLDEYIGTGSIIPVFNTHFFTYSTDKTGKLINTEGTGDFRYSYYYGNDSFSALAQGRDSVISKKNMESYEVLYGSWPQEEDECVIMTDSSGGISAENLAKLGYYTSEELEEMLNNRSIAKDKAISYEEMCKKEFIVLPNAYKYEKNSNGYFGFIEDSSEKVTEIVEKYGIKLKVTGIVKPLPSKSTSSMLLGMYNSSSPLVGYTYKLTDKIIKLSETSPIVEAQFQSEDKSVINGVIFENGENKHEVAESMRVWVKGWDNEQKLEYKDYISSPVTSIVGGNKMTDEAFVKFFDKWVDSQSDEDVITWGKFYCALFTTMQDTLESVGYCNADEPSQLVIYPDTFEGKQGIMKLLSEYNSISDENDKIEYTDYIEELTKQIASIIDTVSGILIAFVAVSLVVSCIMIGIITHISVLERTKEIGILRALGASRGNIAQVFNAETFIIGALSGIIGIIAAMLLCIPANAIINSMGLTEGIAINASVPFMPALILVGISIIITVIGGLIPASAASRKDPVIALRTE